ESEGLSGPALKRWVKFLQRPPGAPAFDACRKMLLQTAPADEAPIRQAALGFQKQLEDALAARGRGKLSKEQAELLQGFLGDNGPFVPGDEELRTLLTAEKKQQLERFAAETARVKASYPQQAPPSAHGLAEGTPQDMKVFLRGNPAKPGEVAPRRFLRALA